MSATWRCAARWSQVAGCSAATTVLCKLTSNAASTSAYVGHTCIALRRAATKSPVDPDEEQLKHVVRDAAQMPCAEECRPLDSSPLSSSSSSVAVGTDSQGSPHDWIEPTLAELDRSIPQVDCKFVADLIRTRNARREEFLREKEAVKSKLAEKVRQQGIEVDTHKVVETALSSDLSEAEKEVLLHTRPEYNDGFVLIDCRTVNEITSWGIIEGAKVLPSHEMFEAFHMTPDAFEASYGFPKPRPEDTVIFYCQYGPRSLMAAQILSWMGYENVLHFRDGFHDWGKQYNLLVRRWMEHDHASGNNVKRLVAFEAARQLQREIAPEFNFLPTEEARRYIIDETRSRGTLVVGEGVRKRALEKLAGIALEAPPAALPGTVDDGVGKGPSRHLHQFMSAATGVTSVPESVKATGEVVRGGLNAGGTMGIGDAQAVMAADMERHLGRKD